MHWFNLMFFNYRRLWTLFQQYIHHHGAYLSVKSYLSVNPAEWKEAALKQGFLTNLAQPFLAQPFFSLSFSDHRIIASFKWLTALNYLLYKLFPLWHYYSFLPSSSGYVFVPLHPPKPSCWLAFAPETEQTRRKTFAKGEGNKLKVSSSFPSSLLCVGALPSFISPWQQSWNMHEPCQEPTPSLLRCSEEAGNRDARIWSGLL